MNYHSNEWIEEKLNDHYNESKDYFNRKNIVGIFVQGSQNYGLDYEDSDIDTKLIVLPTLSDIIYNKKPVSTTHIRENDEHIDFKDIRLYMDTFKKQNLNFLEILFTDYKIINPVYADEWNILVENRELIAHMDIKRAIKSMQGIAHEKYFALEHRFPSSFFAIEKFGYSPKQLHHLVRVRNYLIDYISGKSYKDCLVPDNETSKFLVEVKKGLFTHDEAKHLADKTIQEVDDICNKYINENEFKINEEAVKILEDVQYKIMYKCIYNEVKNSKI